MATTFSCDYCHTVSQSIDNWLLVGVQLLHWDPTMPNPPGGRTLDESMPDRTFDKVECRDSWLVQAGLKSVPEGK